MDAIPSRLRAKSATAAAIEAASSEAIAARGLSPIAGNVFEELAVGPGSGIFPMLSLVNSEMVSSCCPTSNHMTRTSPRKIDRGTRKKCGSFGIDHRQALCSQCRLCEAICPEHAITVDSTVELEAFLSGAVEHFELKPLDWNPGAPDAIATRMARFMKTNTYQDPQAGMKPQGITEQQRYWSEREQQCQSARQADGAY